MDIPVLVEPLPSNGYRATSGEPLRLETEAPTPEEAVQKLRQLIECRIAAGAQFVAVSLDTGLHPLAPFAGMLKGDPSLDTWKQAMAEYRTKRDPDPDAR
jgi:hypothetical protein